MAIIKLKSKRQYNMVNGRQLLNSKIHRAIVTEANLDYIGSISIDENLMDAASIVEWEKVQVLDITNGSRLETYAIKAPRGSGEICINGAAAHLINSGDLVILCTYVILNGEEVKEHIPKIVHVNSDNEIVQI
uniref:Aspartate 1-decarboxylase n=1 Tax=uncultured Poseidoniia archaeon TaxID=1697135 RepID=A0A1B1T9L2_9ARCH|nr:putative aspartate decarboxylase [uncultured Candidatus Thalassoarchaea sp.]|tara:strand:+ start:6986 stop:7384 length:399 start_codon:yes stop_codon:yes gene_type:complete